MKFSREDKPRRANFDKKLEEIYDQGFRFENSVIVAYASIINSNVSIFSNNQIKTCKFTSLVNTIKLIVDAYATITENSFLSLRENFFIRSCSLLLVDDHAIKILFFRSKKIEKNSILL